VWACSSALLVLHESDVCWVELMNITALFVQLWTFGYVDLI